MPERERIWFVPEIERILVLRQLNHDQKSRSQPPLLYWSVHAQAVIEDKCLFHFHHSRTNRLCWYVGRAHQHCPPHNGESHKNHDAWKKERILSLAGGRTRSIGRYPERERTFSQKHSVKEQIKQWYVWLISGQQLLLFYSITKLLTQLKLSFVFTTKFPGISVYFMYNLTSDS